MAKVEIYYWVTCPYCSKARKLLDAKGIKYTGYDITGDNAGREKMIKRTGGPKSVPQIFIGNKYIGGCDDIHALDKQGKLDAMINA